MVANDTYSITCDEQNFNKSNHTMCMYSGWSKTVLDNLTRTVPTWLGLMTTLFPTLGWTIGSFVLVDSIESSVCKRLRQAWRRVPKVVRTLQQPCRRRAYHGSIDQLDHDNSQTSETKCMRPPFGSLICFVSPAVRLPHPPCPPPHSTRPGQPYGDRWSYQSFSSQHYYHP